MAELKSGLRLYRQVDVPSRVYNAKGCQAMSAQQACADPCIISGSFTAHYHLPRSIESLFHYLFTADCINKVFLYSKVRLISCDVPSIGSWQNIWVLAAPAIIVIFEKHFYDRVVFHHISSVADAYL